MNVVISVHLVPPQPGCGLRGGSRDGPRALGHVYPGPGLLWIPNRREAVGHDVYHSCVLDGAWHNSMRKKMQSWRWGEVSGDVAWENIVVPIGNLLDDASQDLTRPIHTHRKFRKLTGVMRAVGRWGLVLASSLGAMGQRRLA